MKTRTLDASGQILFSWVSEQAISHFRHPLHLLYSRLTQIELFSFSSFHMFSNFFAVYLDRSFHERMIPTVDSMTANPISTAKSTQRLFIPVAPSKSCLVASFA